MKKLFYIFALISSLMELTGAVTAQLKYTTNTSTIQGVHHGTGSWADMDNDGDLDFMHR